MLKEHLKGLYKSSSVLERENAVLSLANSEELGELSIQSSPTQQQQQQPPVFTPPSQPEGRQTVRQQPNITSA